ncbi:MAG: hypothetical protein LBM98_07330 [Oscillospiraceae bacterium]|nr:hypothetical protein [Oscillospiraceae bacterium]
MDGGRVRARRGKPPRRYAPPLPRGEFSAHGAGTEYNPCIRFPRARPYSPLGRGAAAAAGWFPPQGATPVQTFRL